MVVMWVAAWPPTSASAQRRLRVPVVSTVSLHPVVLIVSSSGPDAVVEVVVVCVPRGKLSASVASWSRPTAFFRSHM